MSKTIVFPSGETSSEIHVASSVVKRTVRTDLIGRESAVSFAAAVGCCAAAGVGNDAPSVSAARAARRRGDMVSGSLEEGSVQSNRAQYIGQWVHSHILQRAIRVGKVAGPSRHRRYRGGSGMRSPSVYTAASAPIGAYVRRTLDVSKYASPVIARGYFAAVA